jgi:hypothetical protein
MLKESQTNRNTGMNKIFELLHIVYPILKCVRITYVTKTSYKYCSLLIYYYGEMY